MTDHSYVQSALQTCTRCSKPFPAEIWLVIDIKARPDLAAAVQNGQIHQLTCTHCEQAHIVEAPLLLYRLPNAPMLIFSPAEGSNIQEARGHVLGLIEHLRGVLSAEWEEEWMHEMPVVPRNQLKPVIDKGLKTKYGDDVSR